MQVHKNRKEMWYFLDPGIAQIGNKKFKINEGERVIIKKRTPHRIIAEKNKLRVLEIAFGNFNEKDEIRLEDKYGRK
mgnify:CR=1 FL=1